MKVLLTWLFMLMFEFNIQPFLLEDKQGLYSALLVLEHFVCIIGYVYINTKMTSLMISNHIILLCVSICCIYVCRHMWVCVYVCVCTRACVCT